MDRDSRGRHYRYQYGHCSNVRYDGFGLVAVVDVFPFAAAAAAEKAIDEIH